MAVEKKYIADNYPLPVYNYQVVIDGDKLMSFSEASGLDLEYDHVLYRHGFSWLTGNYLIRGQRKPVNVNLKRGIVNQRDYLHQWIRSGDVRDVRIELCDEAGHAVVTWEAIRALPFKLDAPSFMADSSQVAIENLSLIAHDLRIIYKQE